MSGVVAFIRRCLAVGMDHETALLAAEQFEAANPAPEFTKRQARNRRYYEGKRLKASETSENRLTPSEQDVKTQRVQDKEGPRTPKENSTPKEAPSPLSGAHGSTVSRLKSRRCPAGYEPNDGVFDVGRSVGFSDDEIRAEIEAMRDYEFRTPHSDWDATARTWLRTAAKRRPQARSPPLSFGMQDALVRQAGFNMALEEIDRRNGRAKGDHQSDQSVVVALPAPASLARRGG